MDQNESSLVVRILGAALRFGALPFAWPAAALRRTRLSIDARGRAAERAKFDTRNWTPELLKNLEWRRFEVMCAAYFEALGYATRIAPSRVGGGVDIALSAQGSDAPSVLVHCKPWDAYRVGIKPMRELRAAMTSAGVGEGLLVTAGRFTPEAIAFARTENIKLLDGKELLGSIAELVPEKALALLKIAMQGEFLTPTCPDCALKMTSRVSTEGGRKYWGCPNYPRCKQTFFSSAPA